MNYEQEYVIEMEENDIIILEYIDLEDIEQSM